MKKLHGLDHLRAFAIIIVVLFHYKMSIFGHPKWVVDFARFGWTGVDLFFVLSGFLISNQFFISLKEGKKNLLKEFFIKRFFRIIPAFIVVVCIYFFFPAFHEREALPSIRRFLTFTQNFGLNISESGTFSHAWSLCVEEHFYLLFPILTIILYSSNQLKKGSWLLLILFLGGFIIRGYNWNHFFAPNVSSDNSWLFWYKYIYYPTYNRLDGLVIGVAIASIYQYLPNTWAKISKYGNAFVFIGLLVLTAAYYLCYEQFSYSASVFGFPLIAIGYGSIVIGAISPTSILFKTKSNITAFIATISYSIYLTHKGIIHITQNALSNLGANINSNYTLVVCATACVIGAFWLYKIIERPFIRLREKYFNIP